MKNSFTTEMDFINSKSLYLRRLLMRLPDHKLQDILIAPREEFIRNLKWQLHSSGERDN